MLTIVNYIMLVFVASMWQPSAEIARLRRIGKKWAGVEVGEEMPGEEEVQEAPATETL